jgi:hypothetical protein
MSQLQEDIPDILKTLHELKTWIRESCANPDQEILHNVWQEVDYRFYVARDICGAYIELFNDKLLFIKLFQLVFQLVHVS